MNRPAFAPAGVFFDLDGTLLDSAPDLYASLVIQCAEEGVAPPPYEPVRAVVSRGSRAVLSCAFPEADDAALLARVPRYLEIYEASMASHTVAFDGIEPMLEALDARGIVWGVVTNKPGFLTDALLPRLVPHWNTAAVVSGDTLPVKKPDPAPVLYACEQAGVDPARCVFVGDDRRDILAGRAAGLYTVAVRWGYLDGGDPDGWGADAVVDTPAELAALLGLGEVVA
ncbi:phosphoglycolate phosphatase [Luteibacter rhizovicinus]|uniref:phosphoglycolate phosphatase n=1 Tax=Luteibacter rhizovicinus TaxID=242606 RepID=A0A4R3YX87_9GAMM|nr:phosphoglycolate phosphatase [Luteibacter rhizovicinus]TCV97152.1 phosphoglycolate phosphatase [Luteibacter rhizovicinus]